jgi:hypothetical protein
MKRFSLAALALILVVGLQPQSARADDLWTFLFGHQDPRLTGVGIAIGAGAGAASWELTRKHGTPYVRHVSYGAAYGVTTFACAVLYPIVGTIVINRMLTPREAYTGIADCVVPIIGGWIVDAMLPHDAWTDGTPPKPVRHHK